ncbi:MAG: hypothetical protein QMC79_04765 [Anaerosomatales bacterium]|nr:hypothetical protein [Anaerosomatales bacterium]
MKKTMIIAAVVLSMVLGIVAYAYAVDSNPVTVSATVNPRIQLSLTSTALDFGTVLPEDTATLSTTLNVRSNTDYTITRAATGDDLATLLGLSISGVPLSASQPKAPAAAGQDHTDDYSINVPWTTDPGSYTADYVYTVVQ